MTYFAWPITELSAFYCGRNATATITLGSAATGGSQRTLVHGANTAAVGSGVLVTFAPPSGTIDGFASVNLAPGQTASFAYDGTNWHLAAAPRRANSVTIKTATYTLVKADLFDGSLINLSGTFTVTMLSAGSVHAGDYSTLKNTGTGVITIQTTSAQTIDGYAPPISLSPGQAITLTSDGVNWQSISIRPPGAGVIGSPLSTLAFVAATAWPAANTAVFQRFTVNAGRAYRYVNLRLDNSSGNYQVGVVALSGATFTTYNKIMDSGIIAAPVAGDLHIDLGATYLPAGEYALFVWFDNTAATLRYAANSGISSQQLSAETSALVGGVPASSAVAWNSTKFVSGLNLCSA